MKSYLVQKAFGISVRPLGVSDFCPVLVGLRAQLVLRTRYCSCHFALQTIEQLLSVGVSDYEAMIASFFFATANW